MMEYWDVLEERRAAIALVRLTSMKGLFASLLADSAGLAVRQAFFARDPVGFRNVCLQPLEAVCQEKSLQSDYHHSSINAIIGTRKCPNPG